MLQDRRGYRNISCMALDVARQESEKMAVRGVGNLATGLAGYESSRLME